MSILQVTLFRSVRASRNNSLKEVKLTLPSPIDM